MITTTDAQTRDPKGPMPLWPGTDSPPGPPESNPRPDKTDLTEREDLWAAWDEICTGAPAAEVRAAVAADMAALNGTASATPVAARAGAWAPIAPAAPTPPQIAEAAAAVGAVTADADSHAVRLEEHPEWQRIQTVRGALRHAWDVMKEKAGPSWDTLRADVRFQGFWKTASIRACEAISVHAAALANRLRSGTGDPRAADALLKLSDATLTYSTAAQAPPARTPAPATGTDAAAAPMQRLVERKPPTPYAAREDAARAASEVTAHFQAWITSQMGQELAGSDHRRVTALREAWQQLPPHNSQPGPAVGPYSDVAERAKALVTAAESAGRFASRDLQALQALAQAADRHAARLAVTLPPGQSRTAPRAAVTAPAVATPTPSPVRTSGLSA